MRTRIAQVLLEHGAAHVVALDVGHGQLDPRVATDPRVTELSGTNVRDVTAGSVGGAPPAPGATGEGSVAGSVDAARGLGGRRHRP